MLKFSKYVFSILVGSAFVLTALSSNNFAAGIDPSPGLPKSGEVLPFFPNGSYDSRIPAPEKVLGFVMGARPVRYEEMTRYLKVLDESSTEVLLKEYGQTYEARKLYYLIISSPENLSKLDQIKEEIGLLSDPRKLKGEAQAKKIIESTPAIAWMAYSIHGDELSSTDAALQLAYQLAAGTDTLTRRLKENLVIIIDPLQNPDGRERILSQFQSFSGKITSWDINSLQHSGLWPWGRGNHYLFDLNRDWFALVHPESRGKITAILLWNPQLVVDCHEMGAFDTYLFSPPREPFNPFWTSTIHKWWKKFSGDQAQAFDNYGWSYYTREWNEEWFPGYGSSWSIFLGAVGILYEQAGVNGAQVKKSDQTILTYRETVHHQFVSSLANLTTAANNRPELLTDYYREKANAVQPKNVSTYLFVPGSDQDRTQEFIRTLLLQKIEVKQAKNDFTVSDLTDIWHNKISKKNFPKGTYLVSTAQPLSHLVKAILEFDPHMPASFLAEERKELEKGKGTKLYETTSWSVPLAYNLDAYKTDKLINVPAEMVTEIASPLGQLENPQAAYGYLFSYGSRGATLAVTRLLEQEFKLRVAKKSFTVEGKKFAPGTILLRNSENPATDVVSALQNLSQRYGINIFGVNTALAEEGADLGGNEFELLQVPKIGLLANSPINFTDFGAIWHLLDQKMDMKISAIDIARFGWTDLSLYNVLIFPSSWGGGEEYTRLLGKGGIGKLKQWVENGGTLIAIGSAAAFTVDTSVGLSQVRLREMVLDSLPVYEKSLAKLEQAEEFQIDTIDLWQPKETPAIEKKEPADIATQTDSKNLKEADERGKLFMPRGAILRVNLDIEHWLSFGAGEKVPVLVYSSDVFMSKEPVLSVGRFAKPNQLRLGGLLWPEARGRWAQTAYVTRESKGKGQVILFATPPNFRGYFNGAERLLVNAFLLGPGLGAEIPREW